VPEPPPPCVWDLPDPADFAPGGDILAVGADLEPGTVLAGYRLGLFPMHLETCELAWWSPDPRGILPLDALRVTRSLRKSMKRYTITIDSAFADVMRECGSPDRPSGWITDEFIESYTELHRLGWAHSVEAWSSKGDLVGGLYGVAVGGLFAGESMFSRERDASKAALVALIDALSIDGVPRLLDVQWVTDHLATLGAVEVSRQDYLQRLARALELPGSPAFA
jgi:leucyl/phenylalanyl-tRNA--protein transferase